MDETQVVLTGPILVNRSSKGFQVCKEYSVKIVIPLESEELPYVLDAGNHIDSNYPHRYLSGKLCLETDANIKIRFIDGFSLEAWMIEYVEPYYFSYEFFQRYGEFPFGERGHDWEGIIQTYSDYFNEPDVVKTIKTSVYKGYKQDKIEMRGDRAEMSDFPLYLNTVAGGLDRRDQTIGGFSFVVKIYAVPVVEIIG